MKSVWVLTKNKDPVLYFTGYAFTEKMALAKEYPTREIAAASAYNWQAHYSDTIVPLLVYRSANVTNHVPGFSLAACRNHPDYHEPEKHGMR